MVQRQCSLAGIVDKVIVLIGGEEVNNRDVDKVLGVACEKEGEGARC
jgi:hypothetical protein